MTILGRSLVSVLICLTVSGCGTTVPRLGEVWSGDPDGGKMVKAIVKTVYCETEKAVYQIIDGDQNPRSIKAHNGRVAGYFDTWGVQITLNLTIDETGSVSPGAALNTPLVPAQSFYPGFPAQITPQMFSLGLGGTGSSHAQRIDKISLYYTNKELVQNYLTKKHKCPEKGQPIEDTYTQGGPHDVPDSETKFESLLLLQSDLQIKDWLKDAIFVQSIEDNVPNNKEGVFKQNVLSHEIKFEVVSSGNVTPTWKLLRVSANPTGPFFSAGRTRSHDLLLTFGPDLSAAKPPRGSPLSLARVPLPAGPSEAAFESHLASEIGLAVANSIRTTIVP